MSAGPDPARIFSPYDLQSRRTVVAAVSGGSDSIALLHLLQGWLARSAAGTTLAAVTVDHRLRAGSGAEAQAVARFCAARAIAHRIVEWTGEKPETGLPAAARLARYRLLADAANELGADVVLTGHTLDDQIETIRMRRVRGAGRGLAGMAAATLFDARCWIVRPLLAQRRAGLRALLSSLDIAWIDDPTNLDAQFERPRIRAESHTDDDDVLAAISTAQADRRALGEAAARMIEGFADRPVPGLLRLGRDFQHGSNPAGIYTLRILLAVAGGASQIPDEARVRRLYDGLRDESVRRATLSRCVVERRRTGLYLHRELRDLPTLLMDSREAVWDGRFRISARVGLEVHARGPVDRPDGAPPADVPERLARAALATLPAAMRPAGPGRAECETGNRCGTDPLPILTTDRPPPDPSMQSRATPAAATPLVAPWNAFLPDFDLAPAAAVARLIGAPLPPTPPFTGHKDISA